MDVQPSGYLGDLIPCRVLDRYPGLHSPLLLEQLWLARYHDPSTPCGDSTVLDFPDEVVHLLLETTNWAKMGDVACNHEHPITFISPRFRGNSVPCYVSAE